VNFYQDYKELFGAEPGQVLGIGLMTSSSFTKSVATADYDDFLLLTPAAFAAEESTRTSAPQSPAIIRVDSQRALAE